MEDSVSSLETATRTDREICWICDNNRADSREHIIKKSQLKGMLESVPGRGLVTVGADGRFHIVQGSNSKRVKFGRLICESCNNEVTQPFDRAYEHFMNFVFANFDYFRSREVVDWADIFKGTAYDQGDLARYYVKHFGCRIYDMNPQVPGSLRHFINTPEAELNFSLVLYKDFETIDGLDLRDPRKWTSPYSEFRDVSSSGNAGEEFLGRLQDGPVGVAFRWAAGGIPGGPQISFDKSPVGKIFSSEEVSYKGHWLDRPRIASLFEVDSTLKEINQLLGNLQDELEFFRLSGGCSVLSDEEVQELAHRIRRVLILVDRKLECVDAVYSDFLEKQGLSLDYYGISTRNSE